MWYYADSLDEPLDSGYGCQRSRCAFFHSARTPADIILRTELEQMAARLDPLQAGREITRTNLGQPFGADMMRTISPPDYLEREVYVCGPNLIIAATKSLLAAMDFPMQNYYEESFGGAKKKTAVTPCPAMVTEVAIPASQPYPVTTSCCNTSFSEFQACKFLLYIRERNSREE
ncbi:MAG: hypothetical protein AAGG02_18885 [Cyanobacteria bacterium P01_H01_bin.15]